jgi:hypothetical protein
MSEIALSIIVFHAICVVLLIGHSAIAVVRRSLGQPALS